MKLLKGLEDAYFVIIKDGKKEPRGYGWQINEITHVQQPDGCWRNKVTGEIYQAPRGVNFRGQPANFKATDSRLLTSLENGKRIGMLLGQGFIDFEIEGNKTETNPHLEELDDLAKKELPPTLTIKTPSGGIRRIYKTEEHGSNSELKSSDTGDLLLGEIRANVGCQSIISGAGYETLLDVAPAEIKLADLRKVLNKYLIHEREKQTKTNNQIIIPLSKLLDVNKFTHRGNGEYQGAHPKHGSAKNDWNFAFNLNKNTWYCFHAGHECGGDGLSLLAVLEGIIQCGDAKNGLRGEAFIKTLKLAKERRLYQEPTTSIPPEDKADVFDKAIAKEEEWCFRNVFPENHFISLYLKKGMSVSDAYPEYFFAAALSLLSILTNRNVKVMVSPQPLYLNLWHLILGQSTVSRKSTALELNKALLTLAGLDNFLSPDDASPEGFISMLAYSGIRLVMFDEFGFFLAKLNKKYFAEMDSLFCRLYDSPSSYTRTLREEEIEVLEIFITMLAATVPRQLQVLCSPLQLESGFFARFVFIIAERHKNRKGMRTITTDDSKVEVELATWMSQLNWFTKMLKRNGITVEAVLDEEALGYVNCWSEKWETHIQDSEDGKDFAPFFGRMEKNCLKIAALIPFGSSKMKTLVNSLYQKVNTPRNQVIDKSHENHNNHKNHKNHENQINHDFFSYLIEIANEYPDFVIFDPTNPHCLRLLVNILAVKQAVFYCNNLYLPSARKVMRLVESGKNEASIQRVFDFAVKYGKGGCISHTDLLHRSGMKSRDFQEIIQTLKDSGRFHESMKGDKKYYTPLNKTFGGAGESPKVEEPDADDPA